MSTHIPTGSQTLTHTACIRIPLQTYVHIVSTHICMYMCAHKWGHTKMHTQSSQLIHWMMLSRMKDHLSSWVPPSVGQSLWPNTKEKENGTLAFNFLLLVCGHNTTWHPCSSCLHLPPMVDCDPWNDDLINSFSLGCLGLIFYGSKEANNQHKQPLFFMVIP